MTKPYRPGNGAEGELFKQLYCYQCGKYSPDDGCEIQLRSLFYKPGDKEYPVEWIYDDTDVPTCTAFKTAEELAQEQYMDQQRGLEQAGQLRLIHD